jgi:UTP--glucose-1-phosphate uridylyltransferase
LKITKAVITAAGRNQRSLPLQMLIDRDGVQKSVLAILLNEAWQARIEECCVVVCPGDEEAYRAAAGEHAERLQFVTQDAPRGYGHAVYCARDFVRDEPFLHMIGDHIYISDRAESCAEQLIAVAEAHSCAVSGVQPTRETLLPLFGAVGGQRVKGSQDLFAIDQVIEKPTPTQAEQTLLVPGLRTGHYLCFFGLHILTPRVMELLESHLETVDTPIALSPVLNELARQERYVAVEAHGRRYPLDVRYGLLTAQVALALSGQDREEVLANLCELLAQRQLGNRQ